MPWTMLAATRPLSGLPSPARTAERRVKKGAAEAEEHVGADAGGLVTPLALEADDAAEETGHQETLDGSGGEDHLVEFAEVEVRGHGHWIFQRW